MFAYDLSRLVFLLVEDNRHWRKIIRTILVALGAREIRLAESAEKALEELSVTPVDIVICDWEMPGMNGLELVRRVRREARNPNRFVPVIMLTAHTARERVEEARDAGVTEVVTKPVSAQALYDRIVEVIENPRPFVKVGDYFGPDRRRRDDAAYEGPRRRESAGEDEAGSREPTAEADNAGAAPGELESSAVES